MKLTLYKFGKFWHADTPWAILFSEDWECARKFVEDMIKCHQ